MWASLCREQGLAIRPPASEAAIRAVEEAVGCRLPAALSDLLGETDGVEDAYGHEPVMSAPRIAETNRQMRTFPDFAELYMPFEPLLFFGEAGNGDLFAYSIRAGEASDLYVFVWDHEDDSRATTSASLERYLHGERWYPRPR